MTTIEIAWLVARLTNNTTIETSLGPVRIEAERESTNPSNIIISTSEGHKYRVLVLHAPELIRE